MSEQAVDLAGAIHEMQELATNVQRVHLANSSTKTKVVPKEGLDGGPGESRTPDQRFRKPLLYPSELQARE